MSAARGILASILIVVAALAAFRAALRDLQHLCPHYFLVFTLIIALVRPGLEPLAGYGGQFPFRPWGLLGTGAYAAAILQCEISVSVPYVAYAAGVRASARLSGLRRRPRLSFRPGSGALPSRW